MYLNELEGVNGIEDSQIEYKSRLDRTNTIGWIKTIAGFANADGGIMYIGVEDRTGKLTGFTREEADSERNFLNNQINEHLTPRPQCRVTFLAYTVREKERFIIKVSVVRSAVRPVVTKYDGYPAIFMRREGFTNGATYEEIINMSISSQTTAYDMLISDEKYQRSDFSKLRAYCTEHSGEDRLTDKALMSLGFMSGKGLLANGAVLFRDDYDGAKTTVQCSVFSGKNKGSDRIVTLQRFSGCLTDTISFMYEFVLQRMNHSVIKKQTEHETVDAFPPRALFEGIINAVAHRDYYIDGTQIQVDLFRDRLEISSPGGFFMGELTGKTYDLTGIMSKRRNELICGVLVRCGVMEAAGTGFDKIASDYSKCDDSHRPYVLSATDHFTLVLPDLTYEQGITDPFIDEIVYEDSPSGSEHDRKILAYCYNVPRSAQEIASYLGMTYSSYLKKTILGGLVERELLYTYRDSRTVKYSTNHEKVFALEERQ